MTPLLGRLRRLRAEGAHAAAEVLQKIASGGIVLRARLAEGWPQSEENLATCQRCLAAEEDE